MRTGRSLFEAASRPLVAFALIIVLGGQATFEQSGRSTGLPLPRFVSLAADRVNVRFGPGEQYPINWIYAREGLPVTIVSEFDTWRKIQDAEGAEGWVHASLLSSRRTIMIQDEVREIRRTPAANARVVMRAEPGVIGQLLTCEGGWCHLEIAGRRGWLQRSDFWGTLPEEIVG